MSNSSPSADPWRAALESALGQPAVRAERLAGGRAASVLRVTLADGRDVIAKFDPQGQSGLAVEGASLRDLARLGGLPTPEVFHATPTLLVMACIDGAPGLSARGEEHAADLLARLHSVTPAGDPRRRFGFDYDTVIAELPQPNAWAETWLDFFGRQRLVHMARLACDAGQLGASSLARVERAAERLSRWLPEPEAPSLVHGDIWSGNVLAGPGGDHVAAFIDPAPCFAHAEVELAFITLFATFGDRFFARYAEQRPIEPGFDSRRDIYNLYPLLVHTRLFGGGYAASVQRILGRLVG